MRPGRMPGADGLLPGAGLVDGVEREGDFDELLLRGHSVSVPQRTKKRAREQVLQDRSPGTRDRATDLIPEGRRPSFSHTPRRPPQAGE